MSAAAWWISVAVYLVIFIGTWRFVFSEFYIAEIEKRRDREDQYAKLYRERGASYTKDSLNTIKHAAARAPDVWFVSLMFGLFWPLVLTVVVVAWPVKTMSSLFMKWFMHSANRKADREFA